VDGYAVDTVPAGSEAAVTDGGGTRLTVSVLVFVLSNTDVAVTVTDEAVVIVAGAL
jgi:hypothetical protein